MSRTLIKDTLIITLDTDRPNYFYGDLLIDKDQIEKITKQPNEIDRNMAAEVIEGKNLMVMPGLI